MIQFEVSPLVNGSWGYYVAFQVIAPRETFKADLPVMMAQVFSTTEDAAVVRAKSKTEIEAAQRLAKAQHDAADATAKAHYQHNDDVRAAGKVRDQGFKDAAEDDIKRHRIATDVDETIRGIRSIEDTQTGEKQSVNLTDAHDIVERLNYTDPGRYKEVPLRDEVFPLAGHENERDYIGH
jgi:hypothetical protein